MTDRDAIDVPALIGAISHVDRWLRMAGVTDATELASLLDGMMNAMIIVDHEFERRFPTEYAAWVATQGD